LLTLIAAVRPLPVILETNSGDYGQMIADPRIEKLDNLIASSLNEDAAPQKVNDSYRNCGIFDTWL
jgi:hypothetical protein